LNLFDDHFVAKIKNFSVSARVSLN
jgi:hypothetical protein